MNMSKTKFIVSPSPASSLVGLPGAPLIERITEKLATKLLERWVEQVLKRLAN
jgi:hypothetical protein